MERSSDPPRGTARAVRAVDADRYGILALYAVCLRYRRSGVVTFLAAFAVLATVAILLPRARYSARVTIVATESLQDEDPLGGLSPFVGAARRAGISTATTRRGNLSAMIAPIVRSRRFLETILGEAFGEGAHDATTLREYLVPEEDSAPVRSERAIEKLRGATRVDHDEESGITTLTVTLPSPEMAAQVANSLVRELDSFYQDLVSEQVAQQLEFIRQRVEESESQLTAAEDSLREFYVRNRVISDSPHLRLEATRLQREVDVLRELFLTLKTEFEVARIEKVKNLPGLAVLDPAIPPTRPASPHKLVLLLLAAAGATLLGLGQAFVRDVRASMGSDPVYSEVMSEFRR